MLQAMQAPLLVGFQHNLCLVLERITEEEAAFQKYLGDSIRTYM
jgi:hypothetical protein